MSAQSFQERVTEFFNRQLRSWPEASARFEALRNVAVKTVAVDSFRAKVQYNPARIVSTGAKTDAASIRQRPCFLCAANRPDLQESIALNDMEILVNPFPIIHFHLTIPAIVHRDQSIEGEFPAMQSLAESLSECVIFYNGPRCGASAPDHFHFQAISKGTLPLIDAIETGGKAPFGIIAADSPTTPVSEIAGLMKRLPVEAGDSEPKVNILCYSHNDGGVRFIIIPRRRHRPDFYGDGNGQMLLSPASIDLGGVIVAPRREDFDAIDSAVLKNLFAQTCYTQQEINDFISH